MKSKKIKLLKILGGLTGALAIGTIPIISISCSSSNNNNSNDNNNSNEAPDQKPNAEIKTPIMVNDINLDGDIRLLSSGNLSKNDIENNVTNLINSNKSIFIKNYDDLVSNNQNIKIKAINKNRDNTAWGKDNFEEWSKEIDNKHIINWSGYKADTDDKNITISSKTELKKLITDNLNQIVKNVDFKEGDVVTLADVEISIDKDGSLLIPLLIDKKATPLDQENDGSTNVMKSLLKIPMEFINFKLNFSLEISYGLNDSIIKKDLSINYSCKQKINYSNYANYKDIVLDEIPVDKENNAIPLYKNISDKNILSKLNLIKDNLPANHVDGDAISASYLNEEQIKKSLNIDSNTNIDSLQIDMPYRNPSNSNYNGKFTIRVNQKSTSEDGVWQLKTTIFGKQKEKKDSSGIDKLQLKVNDAYVVKVYDETKEELEKNPILNSLVDNKKFAVSSYMGKYEENVNEGLKLPNTWNKFSKLLNETINDESNLYSYGVYFTFDSYKFTIANGGLFTFNVNLREGFGYKSTFEIGDKKYNQENFISKISFRMNMDAKFNKNVPIIQVPTYTVQEIEKFYETNDFYNPDKDLIIPMPRLN